MTIIKESETNVDAIHLLELAIIYIKEEPPRAAIVAISQAIDEIRD